MNGHVEQVSGAKRLRQMLSDPSKTIVAPGVYDGITARLALAQGFDCLYMVRTHLADHTSTSDDPVPFRTSLQTEDYESTTMIKGFSQSDGATSAALLTTLSIPLP